MTGRSWWTALVAFVLVFLVTACGGSDRGRVEKTDIRGVALCERIDALLKSDDADHIGQLGELAEDADSVPAVQTALRDYRFALHDRQQGEVTEDVLRTAMGRLSDACLATGWSE